MNEPTNKRLGSTYVKGTHKLQSRKMQKKSQRKNIEEELAYEKRKIHQKHVKLKSAPVVSHTAVLVSIISQISSFYLGLGVLIPVFFHFLSIIFFHTSKVSIPFLSTFLCFFSFRSFLFCFYSFFYQYYWAFYWLQKANYTVDRGEHWPHANSPRRQVHSCFQQGEAPSRNTQWIPYNCVTLKQTHGHF